MTARAHESAESTLDRVSIVFRLRWYRRCGADLGELLAWLRRAVVVRHCERRVERLAAPQGAPGAVDRALATLDLIYARRAKHDLEGYLRVVLRARSAYRRRRAGR